MLFDGTKRYYGKQIGQYKIIGRIGQGRNGICLLAEANEERIIIKKLKPRIFEKNKVKNCYEARILAALNHGGIPRLLGTIENKDFRGLVLENKDGITIEAMLFIQKHCFTGEEIFDIGLQLIDILIYLHDQGVIHCNIGVSNVLNNHGRVSLIDFSLARWEDEHRYTKDIDYSYLGDFFLCLLYSDDKCKKSQKYRNLPWCDELPLTSAQRMFLKRLLKLGKPYSNTYEISLDFIRAFTCEGRTIR